VIASGSKNALEATAPGGTVRVWCKLEDDDTRAERDGPAGAVVFSVHNAGHIPETVASRIFQRSFSTKPGRARGLGTYGMKLLGERYLGGNVSFTTSREAGTVFTYRLPLASRS
jgi:signal transduction histidine kinase